jgi:autotransporter-associated beta strand protein
VVRASDNAALSGKISDTLVRAVPAWTTEQLSSRKAMTLEVDGKTLVLNMTAKSAQLTWNAQNTGSPWDYGEAHKFWNYTDGSVTRTDSFMEGDYVVFNANSLSAVEMGGNVLNVYGMRINSGSHTFSGGTIRGLQNSSELANTDYSALAGITLGEMLITGAAAAPTFNNTTEFKTILIDKGAKVTVNRQFVATDMLTIDGASLSSSGGNNLAGTPKMTLKNGGVLIFSASSAYGGSIAGTGGILRNTGTGAITLTGDSSFSGTADIQGGTLKLEQNGKIENASVKLNSGTVLDISGIIPETAVIYGLEDASGGSGGTVNLGTHTLQIGKNAVSASGGGTFYGKIEGTGGISKQGGGEFILKGANPYSGVTRVSGGTLTLATATAMENSRELVMDAGTLNASGLSALQIKKLGGTGGTINLGNAQVTIGTGAADEDMSYGGAFSGGGNVRVNLNAKTLTMTGNSSSSFTGALNLQKGTLVLGAAKVLGSALNVGDGTTLRLDAANALADTARLNLEGNAAVTAQGNQQAGDIQSDASSSINMNNYGLTLSTGTLKGKVTGLNGLTKTSSASGGNTLVIAAALNGGNTIGDLTVRAGTGSVNSLTINDGISLKANKVRLDNKSRLSLSAGTTALKADNMTIGADTELRISGVVSTATYDLIILANNPYKSPDPASNPGTVISDGAASGIFDKVYINDVLNAADFGELTIKNYMAPAAVALVNQGGSHILRLTPAGLLWNVLSNHAHGFFWIAGDLNTVTIGDLLANQDSARAMTGTGLRDSQWDGESLIKAGTGTLVLSNKANTYSGYTDILDGTLQVEDLAVLGGSTEIRMGDASAWKAQGVGSPVFSLSGLSGGSLSFDKKIHGNGSFAVSGSGYDLQFDKGAAYYGYTGTTTVSGAAAEGKLSLHGDSSLAAGGSLILGNKGAFDISAISGTQTIIGGLAGQNTGKVALGAKTLQIGRSGETVNGVFNGTFEGTGGIIKNGDGELTLGGTSSGFTGTMEIKSGALILTRSDNISNAAELVMDGGVLRASGAGALATAPLKINKLSGAGGSIELGSGYLVVGNGTAGSGTWNYGGVFKGTRSITFDPGSGNTLELTGSSGDFTGALTLKSGSLTLGAAKTFAASTVTVEGGSLTLDAANALGAGTGVDLKGSASLITNNNQELRSLNSAAGTTVAIGSTGGLSLQSGNLNGTVRIYNGLTKKNGTGAASAAGNTLSIHTNISGNPGNNQSIGNLTVSGGTLSIQGTVTDTLVTDKLDLKDDTRLELYATGFNNTTNPIITALDSITVGNKVRLDIRNFNGQGTLTLLNSGIDLDSSMFNAGRLSVYLDGNLQDLSGAPADPAALLKSFRSSISLDITSNPKQLNLTGGGLRWNLSAYAHGYFWVQDPLNTVTLSDNLADNAAVVSDPHKALQINGNPVWNGTDLVKEGFGTLILTGNNTYTGKTEIKDGTLRISSPSQLGGSATNGVVLGVAPARGKDAKPVLNLSGYGSKSGSTAANFALTIADASASGNPDNVSGEVLINNDSYVKFTQTGAGYTYTGETQVINAILALETGSTGISNSKGLILGGGAVFDISKLTTADTRVNNLRDRGTGYGDTGDIRLGAKTLRIATGKAALFSGNIAGAGGGITKTGAETLTLRGNLTYTGLTTVEEGVLKLEQDAALAASSSLKVDGGTLNFAGISAPGQTVSGLSGSGGLIAMGSRNLTIGAGGAYGGRFSGTGDITVNSGTMALTGRSDTGFSGRFILKAGSDLTLGNEKTLGGDISAGAGSVVTLDAARALAPSARLTLDGAAGNLAELRVSQAPTKGAQVFDRLVGTAHSTINLNTNALTLNSGELQGTVTGVSGLTKTAGDQENTLVIDTNLNGGASIGDLKLEGGTLEIRDTRRLTARNLSIGDGTRVSLAATANDIIHAETITIGLGAELNITFDKTNKGFTIIQSDNVIDTRFTDLYVNGGRQDPAKVNTVKNYHTEIMVGYTSKAVTVSGVGYLWNNEFGNAHGYFWAEDKEEIIQIKDVLKDNPVVAADPSTSMRDFRGLRWNGRDLVKEGAGLLILDPESGGPAPNEYTGVTEIRDGTLQISRAGAVYGSSLILMGANADAGDDAKPVLRLKDYAGDFAKPINGNGSLEVLSDISSVVSLKGAAAYLGTTTVSGATLRAVNSTAIASSSALYLGTNGVYDISALDGGETSLQGLRDRQLYGPGAQDTGKILLGADAANPKTLKIGSDAFNSSFTGEISGYGRIIKTGSGSLRLVNDNTGLKPADTPERAFEFQGGVLILGKQYPIGLYTNGLYVSGGARLELEKANIANPISLGNELVIQVAENQDSKLLGPISVHAGGSSSAPLVVKTGAGVLTLGGNSGFTGNVALSEGVLSLESATALGAESNTLVAAAGAGKTVTLRLNSVLPLGVNNPISLGSSLVLEVQKANSALPDAESILGGIISGTGGIIKNDPGIIALTGRAAYTGATAITRGTLALRGGRDDAGQFLHNGEISKSAEVALTNDGTLNIAGLIADSGAAETTVNNLSGTPGTRIVLGGNTLKIDQRKAALYEGVISGDGGIEKTGSATLALTGLNTYTGLTTVSKGTLDLAQANGLSNSREVILTGDAILNMPGAQSINRISSAQNTAINTGNLTIRAGSLGGRISADTLEKTGPGALALVADTQIRDLKNFDLSQGEFSLQTGSLIEAKQIRIDGAGGAATVLGVTISPAHAPGQALLSASQVSIAGDATLKVTGLSEEVRQGLVIQSEAEITGMFSALSFNGNVESATGAVKPISIDDFSNGVRAVKSPDNKAIYVINKGLVWFNGASNTAHGTFNIKDTSQPFVVDANLVDRAGDAVVRGNVFGWNGKDLTKTGPGSLKLIGENTYTGNTLITEGTLMVAADKTLRGTGGNIEVGAGASFELAYAGSDTFSGALTGDGDLVKSDAGTATITRDLAFAGTARVREGTLSLQSSFALRQAREVAVEEKGVLAVAASPQGAANVAEIKKLGGTGTLLLGTNTLRLREGSFAGTLSGAGVLEQAGAGGVLSLTKPQGDGFTGTLAVNGGALSMDAADLAPKGSIRLLNGQVHSAHDQKIQNLYLGAGLENPQGAAMTMTDHKKLTLAGRLSGIGAITADRVTLAPGAVYSPGNSPGHVAVQGDLTFEAGSIYQVDVDLADGGGVEHDKLVVSGTVFLNSPSVELRLNDITKMRGKKDLQIVKAASRQGEFAELDYYFFDGSFTYTSWLEKNPDPRSGEVWLHLERNFYQLRDLAETVNQNNLVDALEEAKNAGSIPDLYNDLYLVRTSQKEMLRPLYDALSGEIYAGLPGLIQHKDWLYSKEIRNRFRYIPTAGSGKAPLWTQAGGSYTVLSGDGNAADLSAEGLDLQAGAEFGLGNYWFLGATLQGQYNRVSLPARESRADLFGFGGGLYSGGFIPIPRGAVKFGFGGIYGLSMGTVERHIASSIIKTGGTVVTNPGASFKGTLNETEEASVALHSIHGLFDLGLEFDLTDKVTVEPFLGGSWQSVITQDIAETPKGGAPEQPPGGYVPIKSRAQHHWTVSSLLGARSVIDFNRLFSLTVSAGWRHLFGETVPTQEVRVKNIAPSKVLGPPLNVDSVDFGLGLGLRLGSAAKMNLGYNLDLGRSLSHKAALNFSFVF